jgi:hypothetical protein
VERGIFECSGYVAYRIRSQSITYGYTSYHQRLFKSYRYANINFRDVWKLYRYRHSTGINHTSLPYMQLQSNRVTGNPIDPPDVKGDVEKTGRWMMGWGAGCGWVMEGGVVLVDWGIGVGGKYGDWAYAIKGSVAPVTEYRAP